MRPGAAAGAPRASAPGQHEARDGRDEQEDDEEGDRRERQRRGQRARGRPPRVGDARERSERERADQDRDAAEARDEVDDGDEPDPDERADQRGEQRLAGGRAHAGGERHETPERERGQQREPEREHDDVAAGAAARGEEALVAARAGRARVRPRPATRRPTGAARPASPACASRAGLAAGQEAEAEAEDEQRGQRRERALAPRALAGAERGERREQHARRAVDRPARLAVVLGRRQRRVLAGELALLGLGEAARLVDREQREGGQQHEHRPHRHDSQRAFDHDVASILPSARGKMPVP